MNVNELWGSSKMDRKTFLEVYKESIIAEPSGRTYAEIEKDRVGKVMLVGSLLD